MAKRFDEFRTLGVRVIAVSMSGPEGLATYLQSRALPFPVLADPDRTGYRAFELGNTSWFRILLPTVMLRFAWLVLKGGRIRRIPKGETALQKGGDYLVGPDRRLRWAHTSGDPTNRPSVGELLRQARRMIDAGPAAP